MSSSVPSRKEGILLLTGPGDTVGSPPYPVPLDKDVTSSELTGLASHLLGLEAPA